MNIMDLKIRYYYQTVIVNHVRNSHKISSSQFLNAIRKILILFLSILRSFLLLI